MTEEHWSMRRQPSVMQQRDGAESPRERIIVEIGAGRGSLVGSAAVLSEVHAALFKAEPGLRCFAVDINQDDVKAGKEHTRLLELQGVLPEGKVIHVQSDGSRMPFLKSGSVSEVMMKNILGADYLPAGSRENMIHEAARILKPGGLLKVFETATPKKADKMLDYLRKDSREMFEEPQADDLDLINSDFMDRILLDKLPSVEEKFTCRFRRRNEGSTEG